MTSNELSDHEMTCPHSRCAACKKCLDCGAVIDYGRERFEAILFEEMLKTIPQGADNAGFKAIGRGSFGEGGQTTKTGQEKASSLIDRKTTVQCPVCRKWYTPRRIGGHDCKVSQIIGSEASR